MMHLMEPIKRTGKMHESDQESGIFSKRIDKFDP